MPGTHRHRHRGRGSAPHLQYAFRRHRDTTPLAYLRRVRLAQAHDELVLAEPGDGSTVASVAARWGFGRSGSPPRTGKRTASHRPRT